MKTKAKIPPPSQCTKCGSRHVGMVSWHWNRRTLQPTVFATVRCMDCDHWWTRLNPPTVGYVDIETDQPIVLDFSKEPSSELEEELF